MRTTLTLEPDVAQKINQEMHASGNGLKEVINEALRIGLLEQRNRKARPAKFTIKPFDTKVLPGINLDNVQELLDLAEGENRKW